MLLSAVSSGAGALVSRIFTPGRDPMLLTGWQLFLGGLVLYGIGAAGGGRLGTVSLPGVLLLGYMVVLSAARVYDLDRLAGQIPHRQGQSVRVPDSGVWRAVFGGCAGGGCVYTAQSHGAGAGQRRALRSQTMCGRIKRVRGRQNKEKKGIFNMIFSSAVFLFIFLPVVFFARPSVPRHKKAKNALLLASSLIFYAFGQLRYLPLLLLSVALNYGCGLLAAGKTAAVGRVARGRRRDRHAGGVQVRGLLIGTGKPPAGLSLPLTGIALPVGISFFTFRGFLM